MGGENPALSILYVECASGKATRRSLAVAYAMVIGAWDADQSIDLQPVHEAMLNAAGMPDLIGLDTVKRQAWKIYEAAVKRRTA
jgi:hypothetical protein